MPFIDLPDRIPGIRAKARSGQQPWYRFKNVAADEAELFLYNEIGGFGTYAEDFLAELKAVTAPKLRVKVNSPGGSVFEGLACANALRSHPAEVTVQVDGLAASIASVIAMAADRVVVQPQAMIMIHEAAGACLGDAQDMTAMAALLDKISDNVAGAYAERAGGTQADWRAAMRQETWYTAEEAVAAGLADEVMQPPKKRGAPEPDEDDGSEPEMRRRYDLTAYGYQGPPQKAEPSLTINIGAAIDEEFVEQLRAMVRTRGAAVPEVKAVLRQFDEGDLVRVVGVPHEPGHTQGRVAVVNGNAYGICFETPDDDTAPGAPYLWYVDNELEFVAEGPDREDEGYGEEEPAEAPEPPEPAEPEEPTEELRPGVSHPMGRPIPTGHTDDWAAITAHLTEPDPWSTLTSTLFTTASSSAATNAA